MRKKEYLQGTSVRILADLKKKFKMTVESIVCEVWDSYSFYFFFFLGIILIASF